MSSTGLAGSLKRCHCGTDKTFLEANQSTSQSRTTMATKRRLAKSTTTSSEPKSFSGDWLTALVKESAAEDPFTSSSKQERIDKRNAKQRRRQAKYLAKGVKRDDRGEKSTRDVIDDTKIETSRGNFELNKRNLRRLAAQMHTVVAPRVESTHRPRPYQGQAATIFKKRKWEATSIQPRRNDYGGIGLARKSLFLEMDDPSFRAKLDEEFLEHIPGFFGKQRTKAMKKQLNSSMLWKQMSTKKDIKIDGKRLGDMKPDEQVEAMIRAGML